MKSRGQERASTPIESIAAVLGHPALAWSQNSVALLVAGPYGTTMAWTPEGEHRLTLRHEHRMDQLIWSPSGAIIARINGDRTIRIWTPEGEPATTFQHDEWIHGMALSPQGDRIAIGCDDGLAYTRAIDERPVPIASLQHEAPVLAVAWSPSGDRIITTSLDGAARLWTGDGKSVATLQHEAPVLAVAWSPQGDRIATGCNDDTTYIWTGDGKPITRLRHEAHVNHLAWSPGGDVLATASASSTAHIWTRDGKPVATFQHNDAVGPVAWSPAGDLIAMGCIEGTAHIWTPGGEQIAILKHADTVTGVAWSPDGRFLATASDDWTAHIWTPEGRPILTIDLETWEISHQDTQEIHPEVRDDGPSEPGRIHRPSEHSGQTSRTPRKPSASFQTPHNYADSDQPTKSAAEDKLDYVDYADALVQIILDDRTRKPLTMAINAPWGSGKTSLANLMIEQLAPQDRPGSERHVICWFNPWEHGEEDDLGRALLLEVARKAANERQLTHRILRPTPRGLLTPAQRRNQLIGFALAGALTVAGSAELAAEYGIAWVENLLASHPGARTALVDYGIGGAALGILGEPVKSMFSKLAPVADHVEGGDETGRSEDLTKTKESLSDLIEDATGPDRLFVVFIDDLERVRPPRAVEVLEAIKFLEESDRIVVVLLADLVTLASSVEMKYEAVARHDQARAGGVHEKVVGTASQSTSAPDQPAWDRAWTEERTRMAGTFGLRYIQKLVQLQFDLPPISRARMRELLIAKGVSDRDGRGTA